MSSIKLISTSALSKKLAIKKHHLDEILLSLNFIQKNDNGYVLTEEGVKNVLADRIGTYDLVREWKKEGIEAKEVGTSEFADEIIKHMP